MPGFIRAAGCLLLLAAVPRAATPVAIRQQTVTGRPELVVQSGHVRVDGVAISLNGRYVLATGVPTLLWEIETGRVLRQFPVDGGDPAFTNDDEWVVIRHRGTRVTRVFSVATGDEFVARSGADVIAVSRDRRTLALAEAAAGGLRLWDRVADRIISKLDPSGPILASAEFSADGRWLVTRSRDVRKQVDFVELWQTADGSRAGLSSVAAATEVTISPDSRFLAFIVDGIAIELRSLHNWPARRELRRTADTNVKLGTLAFSPDGRWLAGSARDQFFGAATGEPDRTRTVAVWSTADGQLAASLSTPFDHVQGMHFGGKGQWLIASGWLADRSRADVGAEVWDTSSAWRKHPRANAFRSHERPGAISDDGRFAVTMDRRGLWVVDMDGSVRRALDAPVLEVGSVAISPDGRWLAAAETVTSETHRMKVWDISAGGVPRRLEATGSVRGVEFIGDGRLMAVGLSHISIWDPAAGTRLLSIRGTIEGNITSAAACSTGERIAAASAGRSSSITIFDGRTGSELSTWELPGVIATAMTPIAISPDCASVFYAGKLWDPRNGTEIADLRVNGPAAFSPDSTHILIDGSLGSVAERRIIRRLSITQVNAVSFSSDGRWATTHDLFRRVSSVWDMRSTDSSPVFEVPASAPLRFTANPRRILAPNGSNIEILDAATRDTIASLVFMPAQDEWVATTPAGLFDGSPPGWRRVHWRFSRNTFDLSPVDLFFADFYTPGLLKLALGGEAPLPIREIASLDRRSPQLSIGTAAPFDAVSRTVKLRLTAAEAGADATHSAGTGVNDIRLFRNGTLVRAWRGNVVRPGGQPATLEADVALVAGENHFVAYAFNADNVKGLDAIATVTADIPPRPGTAYVIAVGVNRYANPAFDLSFAVADAEMFARQLAEAQAKVGRFGRVETILLPDAHATGANIRRVFELLAGDSPRPGDPQALSPLQPAEPEDLVAIFFAGHGIARPPRFTLLPHDGAAAAVSDRDLEALLEPIDAGTLLLVIDSCESGQVLESEERRLGPMNTKGLAQLAYDKGMYVLTASQSYQAAIEADRLGHGLLTYALVEEGLNKGAADRFPADGTIRIGEWFEFAVSRVPEIQIDVLHGTRGNLSFTGIDGGLSYGLRALQRPRAYYRREGARADFTVARRSRGATAAPTATIDFQAALAAAHAGDPQAQYVVGRAHLVGGDVGIDAAAAERWLRRAADQNNPNAQSLLGLMYFSGRDVPRDYEASLQFLTPAAATGEAMACTLLGMQYEFGFGVANDAARAARLYATAAAQGDQDAQYRLGELYFTGRGVLQDRLQAIAWFEKAAAQGQPEAQRRLKEIR